MAPKCKDAVGTAQQTCMQVVETSLTGGDLSEKIKLLRHLGLRVGDDDDFVETHFGPGEGGQMQEGFLKHGKGKVAESEYLEVTDAGALHALGHGSELHCNRSRSGKCDSSSTFDDVTT
jgi:hypothetical protein